MSRFGDVQRHGVPPVGWAGPLGGLLITALITGIAPPARAEDRAIHWLMREPVTLFDLGIFRLRQDLQRVTDRMADTGELPPAPLHGVYYDWNRQRIVMYVTLAAVGTPPNEATCRDAYSSTVRNLLHGNPSGPRRAESYLENVFLHEGPGNLDRPRDLAADLAATVHLEVTVLPRDPLHDNPQTVKCVGRLDSEPADVKTTVRG